MFPVYIMHSSKFMYFKILLKNKIISFMCVFVSLYEFTCTIVTQELMESVRYPKTGVRVLSLQVHTCAENQILLLWKSSTHWHRVSSPAPSFNHWAISSTQVYIFLMWLIFFFFFWVWSCSVAQAYPELRILPYESSKCFWDYRDVFPHLVCSCVLTETIT